MPVVGRSYRAINNRVNNLPTLPTEIVRGTVSVEMSFEQHPTGTITIESVPEEEINTIRQSYNSIGKTIQIYDYWFRIANYSETRNNLEGPDLPRPIVVYDISVNLEGYNQSAATDPIFVRRSSPDSINRVTTASTISLVNLAAKGGIAYEGFNQDISIPSNEGVDYSVNFESQLSEKLRVNGKFVDYSSRAIRVRDLDKGATYTFTSNEILDSIESSVQKPIQFNNTRLEGSDGVLAESRAAIRRQNAAEVFGGDPLVRRPPQTRELEEGDLDPLVIPADLINITSLDLNFDSSGPRKTYRKTLYINDKLVQEEVRQYGLAYLANDIENPLAEDPDAPEDTPALLTKTPQQYWTQIEEKITQYQYQKIDASASITARDPATNKTFRVLYKDEEGNNVDTSFNSRYLVEVITSGWRLGRFTQEQLEDGNSDSRIIREELDSGNLEGDDIVYFNRLWEAIQFRRIPVREVRSNFIVDPQLYYDKLEDIPFETQKVEAENIGLPKSIGEVIIATPSRDYVYPMMILSETFQSHSFERFDHPENVLIRAERKVVRDDGSLTAQEKTEELNLLKLREDLSTGEDTFQSTRREIQPSKNTKRRVPKNRDIEEDRYIEYSHSASSQDDNYRNSLQNITYRDIIGRPGQPEVLQDLWVRQSELNADESDFGSNSDGSDKKAVYYLTGTRNQPFGDNLESITANTNLLSEAITSAKVDLALQNFLGTSEENMTLAWFYPGIKPGDFITTVDTFNKKQKRVKSINFQLNYQGFIDGQKIVTSDGTSVTLGLWDVIKDSDLSIRKAFEDENGEDGGLEISANINANESQIGQTNVFATIRTRRNRAVDQENF